jgi:hypothetical protein
VIVQGKLSDKEGEVKLLCDKAWQLTLDTLQQFKKQGVRRPAPPSRAPSSFISLRLPLAFSREQLQQLQSTLAAHHQEKGARVELLVPDSGNLRRIQTSYRLPADDATARLLEPIVGVRSIHYT